MRKKQGTQKTQQQVVPTPLWLQRRMLYNLERAAKNIISPSRAKRAGAVLQSLGKEDRLANTNAPIVTESNVAGASECSLAATEQVPSKMTMKVLKATLKKYAERLREFGFNFHLRGRSKAADVSLPLARQHARAINCGIAAGGTDTRRYGARSYKHQG